MKYLLVLASFSLLLSCNGNKTPAGILPPEQMQTIVWQMMQSDEYVGDVLVRDSSKNINTERIKRYRQVFQLNQTTLEAFEKSYDYYMAHPDMLKPMFDTLSARAARRAAADTVVAKPAAAPLLNRLNTKPGDSAIKKPDSALLRKLNKAVLKRTDSLHRPFGGLLKKADSTHHK